MISPGTRGLTDRWRPTPIRLTERPWHAHGGYVGGHSLDDLHFGTAPGTQLYAVKVCSSVSSSCSGVAILEGWSLPSIPNSTGTLNDPVDIISMSTRRAFRPSEKTMIRSIQRHREFRRGGRGFAAGNDGDIPYIIGGSAAATPEVIGLAATNGVAADGIPLIINSRRASPALIPIRRPSILPCEHGGYR